MDNVRTTASFADIGLAGRFSIAGGLLAIALGGAFAAIDGGFRRIQSDFEYVVRVAQPMVESVLEMEISATGAGFDVANYLHEPSAPHRRKFQQDRQDFQKFLKRYRDHATTDQQRDLAMQFEARHEAYAKIGDFLLDAKDRNNQELVVVITSLRDIDRVFDAEIEARPLPDRRRQAVVAALQVALDQETRRLPLLLAHAQRTDNGIEFDIDATIQNIRTHLAALESAAPERSTAVRKFSDDFKDIMPRIEAIRRTHREMAEGVQLLISLNYDLDRALDEEIQKLTGENPGTANDDVIQEVRNGRITLAAIMAALLLALIAMSVYIARRVVRPIKRLVAYSAEVGRGNFAVSVDVKGVAEIGALARAGVEMVGALQSARDKIKRETDERAKMQETLSRNERMAAIGQLAGGIAHDFNNMMMVMGGHADRAAKNINDREAVEKSLDEIRSAIGKAANVVRRLSIFSGRRALDKKVFEIAQFKSEIEGLIQPSIGKQFSIETDFRDEGVRVKCDYTELTQAVLNLVINASHASSPGSAIRIAVEPAEVTAEAAPNTRPLIRPGRYAVVSVADAGTGIPDSVIPRIFEPYFTTKPQGMGTGLGLASVYGFAAQSGGGVAFTTKIGQGTTFRIYLPVTERPAEVLAAQDSSVPQGRGESILLADDDAQVLELVQDILSELGYAVHAANGSFEAVELASDELLKIDVMLSDVVMPVMSGPEAYDIIKDSRPGLPVIFMSGDTNRFGEVKLPDGAPLLEKPVSTANLARALRTALAKPPSRIPAPREEQLATV